MKRGLFLAVVLFLSLTGFLSATAVGNTIPIQIQTLDASENIVTGTFVFQINISNSVTCSPVLYSNTTTRATDSRGIVTYTLENVNLDFDEQYWFCYYRDGVLKETIKASRVPYAFRARNVTSSGIMADSNFDLGAYNFTTSGFFVGDGRFLTNLPSSGSGTMTGVGSFGYIPMWNGTSSLNRSNIFQLGSNIGIGTTSPRNKLNVVGDVNVTGNMLMGWERVVNACGALQRCNVSCSSGNQIIGGGCSLTLISETLTSNYPYNATLWKCESSTLPTTNTAYAICARIGD